MTNRQRLFIRKEFEKKTVAETTLYRDAVLNALFNAHRKKGKGFKPLWKTTHRMDEQQVQNNFALIAEIEETERGWVERIYKANGLKPPAHKKRM